MLRYFLGLGLVAGLPSLSRAETTINVVDHRPLAEAASKLQRAWGVAINYEDIPYESLADVEDVSTPKDRAAYPGYRLLVPRKGRVEAVLQADRSSAIGDKASAIEILLQSYRASGMPGDFAVELRNAAIYIVPTRMVTQEGSPRSLQSLLAAEIEVPYANRSVIDTIVEVLDRVSKKTGKGVDPGTLPFWPSQRIAFGSDRQPARDVLAALFARAGDGREIAYQLLFHPRGRYMINFAPLPPRPVVPAAAPEASIESVRTSGRFFNKDK